MQFFCCCCFHNLLAFLICRSNWTSLQLSVSKVHFYLFNRIITRWIEFVCTFCCILYNRAICKSITNEDTFRCNTISTNLEIGIATVDDHQYVHHSNLVFELSSLSEPGLCLCIFLTRSHTRWHHHHHLIITALPWKSWKPTKNNEKPWKYLEKQPNTLKPWKKQWNYPEKPRNSTKTMKKTCNYLDKKHINQPILWKLWKYLENPWKPNQNSE